MNIKSLILIVYNQTYSQRSRMKIGAGALKSSVQSRTDKAPPRPSLAPRCAQNIGFDIIHGLPLRLLRPILGLLGLLGSLYAYLVLPKIG